MKIKKGSGQPRHGDNMQRRHRNSKQDAWGQEEYKYIRKMTWHQCEGLSEGRVTVDNGKRAEQKGQTQEPWEWSWMLSWLPAWASGAALALPRGRVPRTPPTPQDQGILSPGSESADDWELAAVPSAGESHLPQSGLTQWPADDAARSYQGPVTAPCGPARDHVPFFSVLPAPSLTGADPEHSPANVLHANPTTANQAPTKCKLCSACLFGFAGRGMGIRWGRIRSITTSYTPVLSVSDIVLVILLNYQLSKSVFHIYMQTHAKKNAYSNFLGLWDDWENLIKTVTLPS